MKQAAKKSNAKPFIKWVGGKTKLVPQLSSLLPKKYGTYFEPFLGGGALFFYLQPKTAHINDINKTLIYTYNLIKETPDSICAELCNISDEYISLEGNVRKSYYYAMRDEYNSINKLNLRKAALMIFLNKTCFNGMYRENSKGMFNVPYGDYKNPRICDRDNLMLVSKMLQNVTLTSLSFQDSVANAKKGDFIYFDPPYHPLSETSSFTSYSQDSFGINDQIALRDLFVELDKRGCFVMLSNSASSFVQELYHGYRQEFVLAGRSINSKGTGRGKINELVVLNY